MNNKKTTICFSEDEQKLLDAYMKYQTAPLSKVLKAVLFEDIYDFFDSVVSEEAVKYNKANPRTYTTLELMEELGINLVIDDSL